MEKLATPAANDGEPWEPLFTDDPDVIRESNPHERALCYSFLMWPQESISHWSNRVAGIENPGKALFFEPRCRALVQKLITLHRGGVSRFDMATLAERCSPQEIESFGGWAYIIRHFEFLLSGSGFHSHIDALIDRYRAREYARLTELAQESLSEGKGLNEIIAMMNEKGNRLLKSESDMTTPTPDICVDEMERKMTADDHSRSIPSAFRTTSENLTGDHKRGQILLLGAPPGNGKTAYVMQEAQEAVVTGHTADLFLMESDFGQLTDRYISRNYRVHGSKFISKRYTAEERKAIHDGMEAFSKLENRLHMARSGNYSPAQIDALIQERKQKTGQPCDLIIIDHLDTMTIPRERGQSQYDATKEAMLYLSTIATRENAAMIICAQLNVDAVRNSMGKHDKMPTIGAFRGATSTEKAKKVIILNKDNQAMLEGAPVVEQQIVVCKNNDGPTGFVRSLFLKPFTMHIEDTSGVQRAQYARWLEALNFPMDYERKDRGK